MSHYAVAVFTKKGQSVDELLAPYHEFECTGIVDEYVHNIDYLHEAKKEYEAYEKTMLIDDNGNHHNPYDDDRFYRDPTIEEEKEIKQNCYKGSYVDKDWNDGGGRRRKVWFIPDGYAKVDVLISKIMAFRDFIEYYYGVNIILEHDEPDLKDDNKQKWGWGRVDNKGEVIELIRRTNPNSKWDWYQVGGRYSGLLKLKPTATSGEHGEKSWINDDMVIPDNYVDSAKVKDVDFSVDEEQYNDALRFWEMFVEGSEPSNSKEEEMLRFVFYKPEYYINRYKNKEQYALITASMTTYAVITPDGEWHSKGEMGYWACSSESDEESLLWDKSYMERFVDTSDPEWTLTIVDCHI